MIATKNQKKNCRPSIILDYPGYDLHHKKLLSLLGDLNNPYQYYLYNVFYKILIMNLIFCFIHKYFRNINFKEQTSSRLESHYNILFTICKVLVF